jgi:hypothetical protein
VKDIAIVNILGRVLELVLAAEANSKPRVGGAKPSGKCSR